MLADSSERRHERMIKDSVSPVALERYIQNLCRDTDELLYFTIRESDSDRAIFVYDFNGDELTQY